MYLDHIGSWKTSEKVESCIISPGRTGLKRGAWELQLQDMAITIEQGRDIRPDYNICMHCLWFRMTSMQDRCAILLHESDLENIPYSLKSVSLQLSCYTVPRLNSYTLPWVFIYHLITQIYIHCTKHIKCIVHSHNHDFIY